MSCASNAAYNLPVVSSGAFPKLGPLFGISLACLASLDPVGSKCDDEVTELTSASLGSQTEILLEERVFVNDFHPGHGEPGQVPFGSPRGLVGTLSTVERV